MELLFECQMQNENLAYNFTKLQSKNENIAKQKFEFSWNCEQNLKNSEENCRIQRGCRRQPVVVCYKFETNLCWSRRFNISVGLNSQHFALNSTKIISFHFVRSFVQFKTDFTFCLTQQQKIVTKSKNEEKEKKQTITHCKSFSIGKPNVRGYFCVFICLFAYFPCSPRKVIWIANGQKSIIHYCFILKKKKESRTQEMMKKKFE